MGTITEISVVSCRRSLQTNCGSIPYILVFLDLKDHYLERDVEDAILRELELFLLER